MKKYQKLTLNNLLEHYYIGAQLPKIQIESGYNPKTTTIISSLATILSQPITLLVGEGGDIISRTISEYSGSHLFTTSLFVAGTIATINAGRIALTKKNIITPEISLFSPFLIMSNYLNKVIKKSKTTEYIKNNLSNFNNQYVNHPKLFNNLEYMKQFDKKHENIGFL